MITVAIPSYNRRDSVISLARAITSQLGDGDELLVVDDGSSDGTAEAVRLLPGVRVEVNPTNLGMVPNWNRCLDLARNDRVCIVHDDDVLEPGALALFRRMCHLANGPAVIAHDRADPKDDPSVCYRVSEPGAWSVLNAPRIPSGVVVHKAIIAEVGGFDPSFRYSSDLEFFPRILRSFPMVTVLSPTVLTYRLHGGNYQFDTWLKEDFIEQLTRIETLIGQYAGYTDPLLRYHVQGRMAGNLRYMMGAARRTGRRDLFRQVCRLARDQPGLGRRGRITALIGATTGRAPLGA